MNNITITPKRQKTEIITLIICFVISFGLNAYAIIAYNAPAKELITSIFYVITFAIALYAAWTILRLLILPLKNILLKSNKNK
ncbi:MAG: hypothetical protein J6C78_04405 [Muribaculaceae bacterium]|nr:hypothetical protein [Muribaculaceae bacterium]